MTSNVEVFFATNSILCVGNVVNVGSVQNDMRGFFWRRNAVDFLFIKSVFPKFPNEIGFGKTANEAQ